MCTDKAGNVSSTAIVGNINIDLTPPDINYIGQMPPPDNSGWNNTPVTLSWSCSDELAGIVNTPVTVTLAKEGGKQAAEGKCLDRAGNFSIDTQRNINITFILGGGSVSGTATNTPLAMPSATSTSTGSESGTGSGSLPTATSTSEAGQVGNGNPPAATEVTYTPPAINQALPYILGGLAGAGLLGWLIFLLLKKRKKNDGDPAE
jgi:hypothetical protein